MLREIRFRAWDKKEKKMYPSVGVLPLGGVLYQSGEHAVGDVGAFAKEYKYLHTENIEKTQYTGLKDKNGKEIYEGDIVKWDKFSDVENGFVEMKYGEWISSKKGTSKYIPIWENRMFLEVIGNIYENQELTKHE